MGLIVSYEVDLKGTTLGEIELALQCARACLERLGRTSTRRVRLVGRVSPTLASELAAVLTTEQTVTRRQAKLLGKVQRLAEDIRFQNCPVPADIADALQALVGAIGGVP